MLGYDFHSIGRTFCGSFPAAILIFLFSAASVVKLIQLRAKRKELTASSGSQADRVSKATVSLVIIGVGAFIQNIPYLFDSIDAVLGRPVAQRYPLYPKIIVSLEPVLNFIYIQNFFILYITNVHFRKDVQRLFVCRDTPKKLSK